MLIGAHMPAVSDLRATSERPVCGGSNFKDLQMHLASWPNTETTRYSTVAIYLHWGTALFIFLNLSIGPFMEGLTEPDRTLVVRLHQSSGITILLLTVLRVIWRLTHRPPPLDAGLAQVERAAAKAVHFIIYLAMVGLPLSGWALISANPPRYVGARSGAVSLGPTAAPRKKLKRIMLWGVVPLLPIKSIQDIAADPDGGPARQHELHRKLVRAHAIAGYTLMALLVLHVLGALKHQWFDGRSELYRIGLGRPKRR